MPEHGEIVFAIRSACVDWSLGSASLGLFWHSKRHTEHVGWIDARDDVLEDGTKLGTLVDADAEFVNPSLYWGCADELCY